MPDDKWRQRTAELRATGATIHPGYVNEERDSWTEFATVQVPFGRLVTFHTWLVAGQGKCKLGLPGTHDRLDALGQATGLGVVDTTTIGIIDHSIGFLNTAFTTGQGTTRILALWDQDPESMPSPQAYPLRTTADPDFAYGRLLRKTDIDKALGVGLTEQKVYAAIGYHPALSRTGHGTHVLDLAAGRRANSPFDPTPVDAASTAPILAAQLPWRPYKDTSGGSLCVHVLDALRWMCHQTQDALVVNISDGAYAGPGQGRSLLERAMTDLVAERTSDNGQITLRLVVAAGNGAERRGHATGALLARTGTRELLFNVMPDTPTDNFIEIWFDANGVEPDQLHDVTMELAAPDGSAISHSLAAARSAPESGALVGLCDSNGGLAAFMCASDQSPDAPNTLGFLVAIAPTRLHGGMRRGVAPHGVWSLVLRNGSQHPVSFSAQIQRANPALGDPGTAREARFLAQGATANCITHQDTLNNIATGDSCIVVGGCLDRGMRWPDPSKPNRRDPQTKYSSRGGSLPGTRQVDVLAPSDDSEFMHGVIGSGTVTGSRVRMDGTSVAAPQVVRRIVNFLAAGRGNEHKTNAAVIAALTTPYPSGPAAQTPVNATPPRVI